MELTPDQVSLKQSREAIIQAVGAVFRGRSCRCPYHDDKNASAGIFQSGEGWRFKCHGCGWSGDVFDVMARQRNCAVEDVLREHRGTVSEPPKINTASLEQLIARYSDVEKVYKYTHPETRSVELVVVRYRQGDKKQFAQLSPRRNGWVPQGLEVNPLYNRTRIAEAETVIVCEGEKAVHAFTDLGFVATTSPGGSKNAKKADWSPLKGKKIYIWPDNDDNGFAYAEDVRKILEPVSSEIYQIDLFGLGLEKGDDIVEFLERNPGTKNEQQIAVEIVLRDSEPVRPSNELDVRFARVSSGEWVNIEWPWYEMTWQAQALVPDTVTAICGDPGSGKSFAMLEAFSFWHAAGYKVALFMLEDDRAYHLNRVLAQLAGNSLLTNLTWLNEHGHEAQAELERYRDMLDSFGRCVHDAPDRMMTLPQLADWFEDRCKDGAVICGIDPITAAKASDKPWIDDQAFIFRVQEIAKRYHSRLIYTIHPRIANGKAGPNLSRLAGGAAYSRFSHSVFWISRHDNPLENEVYGSDTGKRIVSHERSVRITKARNGPGAGLQLAFTLNPDTLRFHEYGTVLSPAKTPQRIYDND